jgi:hypothetical protein
MDKNKVELVKLFINNAPMASAVLSVVRNSFMTKKKDEDIHLKAGRFIALELLDEAVADLDRFVAQKEHEATIRSQIGL